MIGTTLGDIRDHIEALASVTGEYYLVCGRYGDQPVPATGLRFESRPAARAAARATEQYRAALRRYDPRLPYYDVIVCQRVSGARVTAVARRAQLDRIGKSDTEAIASKSGADSLIDFCHTVAGAVFETIAASSHDALEGAIMETYLAAAETLDGPDELCLRLLASIATELDRRLDSTEQTRILDDAAGRLPRPAPTGDGDPLEVSVGYLQSVALFDDYSLRPCPDALDDETRSWEVTLSEYALEDPDGRLVTLPLVVDVLRRYPGRVLTITLADGNCPAEAESTWTLRLTAAPEGTATGLLTLPTMSEP